MPFNPSELVQFLQLVRSVNHFKTHEEYHFLKINFY